MDWQSTTARQNHQYVLGTMCNLVTATAITAREFALDGNPWKPENQVSRYYSCLNVECWISVICNLSICLSTLTMKWAQVGFPKHPLECLAPCSWWDGLFSKRVHLPRIASEIEMTAILVSTSIYCTKFNSNVVQYLYEHLIWLVKVLNLKGANVRLAS